MVGGGKEHFFRSPRPEMKSLRSGLSKNGFAVIGKILVAEKISGEDSGFKLMNVGIDNDTRSYKNILKMHHKNSEKILTVADIDQE